MWVKSAAFFRCPSQTEQDLTIHPTVLSFTSARFWCMSFQTFINENGNFLHSPSFCCVYLACGGPSSNCSRPRYSTTSIKSLNTGAPCSFQEFANFFSLYIQQQGMKTSIFGTQIIFFEIIPNMQDFFWF